MSMMRNQQRKPSGLPAIKWNHGCLAVMPLAASSVAEDGILEGSPADAFWRPMHEISGVTPAPFRWQKACRGAAHAALHFVEDHQNAVCVAQITQAFSGRHLAAGGCRPSPCHQALIHHGAGFVRDGGGQGLVNRRIFQITCRQQRGRSPWSSLGPLRRRCLGGTAMERNGKR